jgi:hypothetical protein
MWRRAVCYKCTGFDERAIYIFRMEEAHSSETSVYLYETTLRH